MFERLPKESVFISWVYVVLWSGFILVTVPFARGAVDYVRGRWGGETFTYGVTAVVILVSAAALVILLKQRRKSLPDYAWLLAIAGLVVYLTFGFKDTTPVEAIHYLQYGILSLLLYRAFTHRVRDYSIYAAAAIAGTIVGMIDETVQWLTPGRHFGLNDIWLNFTAVALVQAALGLGIRPKIVSSWPNGVSLRRLCSLSAAAVAYLGLCLLNTPDRIAWYATHIPMLDFIDVKHSVMVEYGYLHGDAETGLFRSRMTAEDLRRLARDRADEGGRILDRYQDRGKYLEFLDIYTPISDPFLHEARVHLFSRDVNLERARSAGPIERRRQQFTTAYRENRILEDYFGALLHTSSYPWPAELKAEVRKNMQPERKYESLQSRYLITAYSQQQVFWFFLGAVLMLLLLGGYFGRRRPAK